MVGIGAVTPFHGQVLGDQDQPTQIQANDRVSNRQKEETAQMVRIKEQEAYLEKVKATAGETSNGKAAIKAAEAKLAAEKAKLNRADDVKKMGTDAAVRKEAALEAAKQKQAEMAERREKFAEEIKEKQEEARAKFESEREAFKARLETIKDEKKQKTLENLAARFETVNTNRTDAMTKRLNKMGEILDKVSARATVAQNEGKDTSAVDTAVSAAQSALSAAKVAVANQAGKQYTIGITYESNLKNDVARSLEQMRTDFAGVEQSLKTAHEAVQKTVQALAAVVGKPATSVSGTTGVQSL